MLTPPNLPLTLQHIHNIPVFFCLRFASRVLKAFSYVNDVDTFSMVDKVSNQVSSRVQASKIKVTFGRTDELFFWGGEGGGQQMSEHTAGLRIEVINFRFVSNSPQIVYLLPRLSCPRRNSPSTGTPYHMRVSRSLLIFFSCMTDKLQQFFVHRRRADNGPK